MTNASGGERQPDMADALPEALPTPIYVGLPELVGNTALHLVDSSRHADLAGVEQKQAVSPLDEMRAWIIGQEGRIARGKLAPEFVRAGNQLERIHQAYTLADPNSGLPEYAPARFLANFTKFIKATGRPAPDLSHRSLVALYEPYVQDVKALHEHGVAKASDAALYHGQGTLRALQRHYQGHAFIGVSEINKAFLANRSDPGAALAMLEQKVQHLKGVVEPELRTAYGYDGEWSDQFIKHLCESTTPVEGAKQVFETMRSIQEKYPQANMRTIERWARESVIDGGRKLARVAELLKDVPTIAVEREDLQTAASQLQVLRLARLAGVINPMPMKKSAMVQRFLRVLDANWHEDFDVLDVPAEASRLYFAARDYNATLEQLEDPSEISLEPHSLYGMLRVFARDVALLRTEGPAAAASDVARFYGPGVYEHFIKKYQNEPLLKPGEITRIVSKWPFTADMRIQDRVAAIRSLRAEFGDTLSSYAYFRFSEYPDGADKIRRLQQYSDSGALDKHPWVKPSDVQRFFFSSSDPEAEFEAWAVRAEALSQLAPKRLSICIRRHLARDGTIVSEALENFQLRKKEILDTHKGNPFVTDDFAALWAARSPRSYLAVVRDFLERIDVVSQLLDQAGEEVDYIALRQITFASNKPEVQVGKYLTIKQALLEQFSGHEQVETWMIEQAAAFSNTEKFAAAKLSTLCRMKNMGVFNFYLDDTRRGRSPHETIADQAWHKIPENAVVYMEDYARRQQQVEHYLSCLEELDRLAVETVLGFISGAGKSALERELGVTDLETYVYKQVLPKLKDQFAPGHQN